MKVSIIIPVYKVEKYIERCLLSALNQTWTELEIILVNDCTPDDSMKVVECVLASYIHQKEVVILQHAVNRGLSAARNTGIEKAVGDYIYFLDSDDYLPLNSIELLAKAAVAYDVDFVIGNYKIEGVHRHTPPLLLNTGLLPDNESILTTYSRDEWFVMAWNKLVKRSFVCSKSLYFKEGIVHEDDLWSFLLACQAQKAYVINETTYFYCLQSDSITGRVALRNLECRVQVIKSLYDFITSSPLQKENRFVYITFEALKAKYFDRILYFVKDESFRYASYQSFREKKYIPLFRAGIRFRPGFINCLGSLHYLLPVKLGYLYFKLFVSLSYKLLILPAKVKQWLRLCMK